MCDYFKPCTSIPIVSETTRLFSNENLKFSKSRKTANLGYQPYPTLPFE
jgi:hypothetical protein